MRLAHLSDIHVFEGTSMSVRALLNKRLLGAFNWWTTRQYRHSRLLWDALCRDISIQNPDHMVITGDLSNLSLPSEFAQVQKDLAALPLGPARISVIPGNHDAYIAAVTQTRLFEQYFAPYMRSFSPEPLPPLASSFEGFPFVRVLPERVVVIGTSTAVPTSIFSANGRLGCQQLHRLRTYLQAWKGWYRVVLIHHPPMQYKHDVVRGLEDKRALQDVLREVGCELILHGHEHRDLVHALEGPGGPIPVIGVGSATYVDPNPTLCGRYNIYTLTEGRLTHMETRAYDASGTFRTFSQKNPELVAA